MTHWRVIFFFYSRDYFILLLDLGSSLHRVCHETGKYFQYDDHNIKL